MVQWLDYWQELPQLSCLDQISVDSFQTDTCVQQKQSVYLLRPENIAECWFVMNLSEVELWVCASLSQTLITTIQPDDFVFSFVIPHIHKLVLLLCTVMIPSAPHWSVSETSYRRIEEIRDVFGLNGLSLCSLNAVLLWIISSEVVEALGENTHRGHNAFSTVAKSAQVVQWS